ncbi:MAG: helix-turn-helix domain-containing protein [Candidatus Planktophila sp.]|nr:helix-turn-helix domain-containing protein [Candidatus Planktophila sp.]
MKSKTIDARRWASIAEAAEYIHVSPTTMRRMIASGEITGCRVGPRLIRIDLNQLDATFEPIPNAASI